MVAATICGPQPTVLLRASEVGMDRAYPSTSFCFSTQPLTLALPTAAQAPPPPPPPPPAVHIPVPVAVPVSMALAIADDGSGTLSTVAQPVSPRAWKNKLICLDNEKTTQAFLAGLKVRRILDGDGGRSRRNRRRHRTKVRVIDLFEDGSGESSQSIVNCGPASSSFSDSCVSSSFPSSCCSPRQGKGSMRRRHCKKRKHC